MTMEEMQAATLRALKTTIMKDLGGTVGPDWKKLARDGFALQNKVRQNPRFFAKQLEVSMKFIDCNGVLSRPGWESRQLQEGTAAYAEAIEFLNKQKALPPLRWAKQLACSAADHVNDIGPQGVVDQIGTGTC